MTSSFLRSGFYVLRFLGVGVVVGVGTGVGYARRSPVCLFGKAKSCDINGFLGWGVGEVVTRGGSGSDG